MTQHLACGATDSLQVTVNLYSAGRGVNCLKDLICLCCLAPDSKLLLR
jgi:hypothetical protein